MWGGPTPHNLVTLSLCCAVRTCSKVPITSSDRDTTEAREGRPHSPSLGHPYPGAGSSFTQREVPLQLGIRPASNAARRVVGPCRGYHPFWPSRVKEEGLRKNHGTSQNPGAVTRIGSCSLEKRQGRSKRKQCMRSDRL